jgi:rare lipoprotein A
MRGVQRSTFVAALTAAALIAALALYVGEKMADSLEDQHAQHAAIVWHGISARHAVFLPEATEMPNRAKKAAREKGRTIEARLTPQIPAPTPPKPEAGPMPLPQIGRASWYDLDSATASGENMDGDALTAAHRTLPLGAKVKVENLENGRAVVVRINDRGPFAKDRIIDLSKAAAAELGMIADGIANVRVSPVGTEVAGVIETSDEAQ